MSTYLPKLLEKRSDSLPFFSDSQILPPVIRKSLVDFIPRIPQGDDGMHAFLPNDNESTDVGTLSLPLALIGLCLRYLLWNVSVVGRVLFYEFRSKLVFSCSENVDYVNFVLRKGVENTGTANEILR